MLYNLNVEGPSFTGGEVEKRWSCRVKQKRRKHHRTDYAFYSFTVLTTNAALRKVIIHKNAVCVFLCCAGTLICPCWIRPAPWCPSTPPCLTTQRGTWNPHHADVCIDSLIVWQNICSVRQLLLDWKTHLLIDCKSQRRLLFPPPPITRRCCDQSAHTDLSSMKKPLKSWWCEISPKQSKMFSYIWRRRFTDQDICSFRL